MVPLLGPAKKAENMKNIVKTQSTNLSLLQSSSGQSVESRFLWMSDPTSVQYPMSSVEGGLPNGHSQTGRTGTGSDPLDSIFNLHAKTHTHFCPLLTLDKRTWPNYRWVTVIYPRPRKYAHPPGIPRNGRQLINNQQITRSGVACIFSSGQRTWWCWPTRSTITAGTANTHQRHSSS